MRWIEIGSQFMSADEKKQMKTLFPEARIVQHYGLTEASRSTFLNVSGTDADLLASVGRVTGSTEVRITPDGAIAIRGDHVALGLIGEQGRIDPLTDTDGWLVTKDRGELRDGILWYHGRLDDQINIGGLKIGAESREASVVGLVPGAAGRFAVTAVPDAVRGEVALLTYETDENDQTALIEAAARVALARRGIEPAGALRVLAIERLPRTETNKIRRAALRNIWTENRAAEEGTGPAYAGDVVLSETESRLATSWRKVIGPVALTSDSGFYDVGGDSLSSVQIGLVMEGEGWPRAVVRATFEGRPLSEVARLSEDHSASDGALPNPDNFENAAYANRVLPDSTVRNWSISLTRGFMVLSVVLSHWGPGFFSRLGLERQAELWLSVIYRAGTPGFATIFGLGIGYFMLPGFAKNRNTVLRRMRLSFCLVAAGAVLLASIHLLNAKVQGDAVGGLQFGHAFYSVLAYYTIMLGTARLWLPTLAGLRNPLAVLVAAVPILWLAWQAAVLVAPEEQLDSILEWARLMFATGGYNVFKMTMVTVAGAALGLWISRQQDTRAMAGRLLLLGSVSAFLCLFAMGEMSGFATLGERLNPAYVSVAGQMFYVALAAFLVGAGLHMALNWPNLRTVTRLPMKALIVTGGLALPIYVLHGMVLPVRDVLAIAGLSQIGASAIPMALFVTVIVDGARRLSRMYFG